MTINAVTANQTLSLFSKITTTKTEDHVDQRFTIPSTITAVQKKSPDVYEELSGKYDIRNATFGEVTEIADALYKAGEISLGELAALTFDYDRATNYMKQAAGMPASAEFSMYKSTANGSNQRDWIAEIEARASDHFKYGNLVGYQLNSKLLAILQKFDTKES